MWRVFPNLRAEEVHNQGVVDGYIDSIWWPYWKSLSEQEKSVYLDKYLASPEWRENIAERYEWDGLDEHGDPIWRSPVWLTRGE